MARAKIMSIHCTLFFLFHKIPLQFRYGSMEKICNNKYVYSDRFMSMLKTK